MATIPTARLIGSLRSPRHAFAGEEDLLREYRAGNQAAFAEIVRRHGPLVLGVCRRMLSHHQDAEDAFQAAFIVLARRSSTIRDPQRLAGWLHAVAVRTSRGIRQMRTRREQFERTAEVLPDASFEHRPCPDADLAAIFDEEMAQLPELYRTAMVVCELQGRSRREASEMLDVPEGTLSSRLAKARRMLAARLTRRGVSAPAVGISMIAGSTSIAHVTPELLRQTISGLTGVISERAAMAAEGVIKAMIASKLHMAALVSVLVFGMGSLATIGLAGDGNGSGNRAGVSSTETVDELVMKLGNTRYVHREEAAKQLERIGPAADSALKAGMQNRDPEIARRSADLRQRIRKTHLQQFREHFLWDPEAAAKLDHPLWNRFVELVGNDKSSRALFAAILKDERGLARLAEADMLPQRAGKLYAEEMLEQFRALPSQRPIWGDPRRGQQQGGGPAQQVELLGLDEPDLKHEHAIVFLLGTFKGTEKGPEEEITWQNSERWHLGKYSKDPEGQAAARRIYAKWLEQRTARILTSGLEDTWFEPVAELLPLARKVAQDKARPSTERIAGFSLMARLGSASDLQLIASFTEDKMPYRSSKGEKWTLTLQVRDLARAAQLLLAGIEPSSCGFRIHGLTKAKEPPSEHPPIESYWFMDDASREAAHAKAMVELAKSKK